MTEANPNDIVAPVATPRVRRNPFELVLSFGAIAAIVIGIIVNLSATAAYKSDAYVSELANTLSGPGIFEADSSPLVWAGLGTQLWQLGVLVLVGMVFYWMTRWNATHKA